MPAAGVGCVEEENPSEYISDSLSVLNWTLYHTQPDVIESSTCLNVTLGRVPHSDSTSDGL